MNIYEFKEAKDSFLNYIKVERNFSKNTSKSYGIDYSQFLEFWERINNTAKSEVLLKEAIDRFFIFLFHEKNSNSSIARKISSFKSLEKYLAKTRDLNLNLNLSRPKIEKKIPIYLSQNEMFNLLDVETDKIPSKFPLRDSAILELLYATGIRCSELVNIKIKDINLDNRTVKIKGKGSKERLIPFNSKSLEKITKYIKVERALIFDPEEHLFLNLNNEQLSSRTIQRIIKMFRKFLNIEKKITPHKIRHSFATHLLNEGVDIRTLQELLGHSSISSTEKYTHISITQLKDMCEKFHPLNKMKNDTN